MGVRVDFLTAEPVAADEAQPKAVASVPASAMRKDGDTDYVLVVRGDELERRAVRVGRTTSDAVELLSGVRAGERVVTGGPAELAEGQRVRVN
jgi:hypothetical protein